MISFECFFCTQFSFLFSYVSSASEPSSHSFVYLFVLLAFSIWLIVANFVSHASSIFSQRLSIRFWEIGIARDWKYFHFIVAFNIISNKRKRNDCLGIFGLCFVCVSFAQGNLWISMLRLRYKKNVYVCVGVSVCVIQTLLTIKYVYIWTQIQILMFSSAEFYWVGFLLQDIIYRHESHAVANLSGYFQKQGKFLYK